jgi:hypothetical protein
VTAARIELVAWAWFVRIRLFAERIRASSSTCYPVIRQRDGELVSWFVRDRGFLNESGDPL